MLTFEHPKSIDILASMEIKVLYEDNHVIAVYKPAGVLVQKGDSPGHDDDTLYWQVKSFIKERDKKPGNVFLGVLHRLDRPVSGIVLFAKTSKGAARLSEQFRNRTVNKTYHALVHGVMEPKAGILENYLEKDNKNKIAIVSDKGDLSRLAYETINEGQKVSLIKISPETGRFHQIRAQLAAAGHPIVGDIKYGSKEKNEDGSIDLCATEIEFTGATDGERHSISIDYLGWDL